jgi:hypothetical protein
MHCNKEERKRASTLRREKKEDLEKGRQHAHLQDVLQ